MHPLPLHHHAWTYGRRARTRLRFSHFDVVTYFAVVTCLMYCLWYLPASSYWKNYNIISKSKFDYNPCRLLSYQVIFFLDMVCVLIILLQLCWTISMHLHTAFFVLKLRPGVTLSPPAFAGRSFYDNLWNLNRNWKNGKKRCVLFASSYNCLVD